MTNTTSTGRSGVVESWVPNPRQKPGQKRSSSPRKLLRGCLKFCYIYLWLRMQHSRGLLDLFLLRILFDKQLKVLYPYYLNADYCWEFSLCTRSCLAKFSYFELRLSFGYWFLSWSSNWLIILPFRDTIQCVSFWESVPWFINFGGRCREIFENSQFLTLAYLLYLRTLIIWLYWHSKVTNF